MSSLTGRGRVKIGFVDENGVYKEFAVLENVTFTGTCGGGEVRDCPVLERREVKFIPGKFCSDEEISSPCPASDPTASETPPSS